jgi:hypothetical protein
MHAGPKVMGHGIAGLCEHAYGVEAAFFYWAWEAKMTAQELF